MFINKIKRLQIDLISSCNAYCLFCSRQNTNGESSVYFPKNKKLSLASFQKILADPILENLEEIFFCGNYGDALACTNLIEYLNLIKNNSRVIIHTNGSLGSQKLWKALASLKSSTQILTKFSIDGLEDTNAIYRRGLDWTKIMENAQYYIEHGGRAVWKFIVFEHNKHQIEQAKELSEKMGFIRFEVRQNYSQESEHHLFQPATFYSAENTYAELQPVSDKKVSCKSLSDQSIYLDFDEKVWPCCWIPDWKYSPTFAKRKWHNENIEEVYGEVFNDIKYNSLSKIIQQQWFKDLKNCLVNEVKDNSKMHPTCPKNCSVC